MKPLHVLLTCHDAVGRFADCIESIENQEHVDLRLHVFDDASSDGSARVAEAWLESSRFEAELIRQGDSRGIPHAIVSLIEKIEDAAAAIVLLDARDRLTNPHALHRMQLVVSSSSCMRCKACGFVSRSRASSSTIAAAASSIFSIKETIACGIPLESP